MYLNIFSKLEFIRLDLQYMTKLNKSKLSYVFNFLSLIYFLLKTCSTSNKSLEPGKSYPI